MGNDIKPRTSNGPILCVGIPITIPIIRLDGPAYVSAIQRQETMHSSVKINSGANDGVENLQSDCLPSILLTLLDAH